MSNKEHNLITIENNKDYLRKISIPVDIKNDKDLKDDIEVLRQFCEDNDVLAMASIQLEIPKRLIYLKNTDLDIVNKIQDNSVTEEEKNYNEARVLINPVVISKEGLTEYWESCASCLDNCGRVLRPYKIELEYYDINDKKHKELFEGFEATVLSHELDHLDGILHMDIAEEVIVMPSEERKKWRQSHGYKIYSKTGKYDLLKSQNNTI